MAKVLGISGSPRKGGNSDTLLRHILIGVENAGAITEGIHLRDYQFQSCIGCEKCRKAKQCIGLQDGMQLIYPKIIEARGLVLISPTHNYNVTALIKAFIDRLYCFYEFSNKRPGRWSSRLANQNRKAIIVSIGEQASREEGMVFTIEPRLTVPGYGVATVENMVIITKTGTEYLSTPQTELIVIGST